jgi:sugar transferase (PEP-CTERM system associated)
MEAAVVVLSVFAASLVRFSDPGDAAAALAVASGAAWVKPTLAAGIYGLALASMGLYQLRQRVRFAGVLTRLLIAVCLATGALGLISYLWPPLFIGRGVVALSACFSLAGLALTRYGFLRIVDEDYFKRRVLIWGAGRRAAAIAANLRRGTDQRGFRIVGYIRTPGDMVSVPAKEILESPGEFARIAMHYRVEEIVVAMDDRRRGFPAAALLGCRRRGLAVCDLVQFLERESGRVNVEVASPSWFIFGGGFRCDLVRVMAKRIFDVALSLLVLLIGLPVALMTTIAIFLEDRGPILYSQLRVGQNGCVFPMLKFRSMRVNAEPKGEAVWAQKNDTRVTKVGATIRRFRIDELPQILNVLAGHMSFVGPRPERPAFVVRLTKSIPYYSERHFVKPGITGWAQVRCGYGSSEKDAQRKLEYDLYYVKNQSIALDLMILLQSLEIVVFGIGSR